MSDDQTGAELLKGLANGRADAWAELYDRFGRRLFAVACRMAPSQQDAEDVVQEGFLNLYRARRSMDGVRDPAAYVFSALRRTALRHAQRRLAAGRREPSPQLRDRVLDAIRREAAKKDLWRFAAAAAAVLMLCLNLGMSAANHMDWHVQPVRPRPDVRALAGQVRRLLPDLSELEARATVESMWAAQSLVMMPDLRGADRVPTGARPQPKETADGTRSVVD